MDVLLNVFQLHLHRDQLCIKCFDLLYDGFNHLCTKHLIGFINKDGLLHVMNQSDSLGENRFR
ncbi:hypothetical protein D3C72_2029450 [compost metagenome]